MKPGKRWSPSWKVSVCWKGWKTCDTRWDIASGATPVVEPLVSLQWFLDVGSHLDADSIAGRAHAAVQNGEIQIVPERFGRVYLNWLENIRDWCISRQLWWGHRIPVWYCDGCGQASASIDDLDVCPSCGSAELHQDSDVLDTWFSSGLWPHSTLGWPENTQDLRRFYPTAVLECGYDILFFLGGPHDHDGH